MAIKQINEQEDIMTNFQEGNTDKAGEETAGSQADPEIVDVEFDALPLPDAVQKALADGETC